MMAQCAASGTPLGVMLLDLDRFKEVNDTHGHGAGDEVLSEFARRLQANVRGVDLVARMGGEEFLVAMPDADEEGGAIVAERVRRAVEEEPFSIGAAAGRIRVTVSAGLTVAHPPKPPVPECAEGLAEAAAPRISGGPPPREPDTARSLLNRADEALYKSKNAGRNRVTTTRAA